MNKLLKAARLFVLMSLFVGHVSWASGFDLMTGAFSVTGRVDDREGSISNLGIYRIGYGLPLMEKLKLNLGYTLIMTDTVGGDLGFGIDAGLAYFPLTAAQPLKGLVEGVHLEVRPLWRPFVGVGFHQRQYQSLESSYAGFSVSGGLELALNRSFDLKAEGRYGLLAGPGTAEADEVALLIGIAFSL